MQKLLLTLKKFYKKNKRDFPWRRTRDPYCILVSEIMLQQTQASRVVPFYTSFVKKFPTAKALAKAPLSDVLTLWQGLGYNRRAKFLHASAKRLCSGEMNGSPTPAHSLFTPDFWESLPGVGPYTARAVVVFAFNKPTVFIETNIRTVYTHFYFPKRHRVGDAELLPLIEKDLKHSKMQPRDFYSALMDYGSYLKASGVRINKKSAHYTKQSKFEGSARQLRGAILRELLKQPLTLSQLIKKISPAKGGGEFQTELARLKKENLVSSKGSRYAISEA